MSTHIRFVKGHGTGNDFVVLPDPDAELDLEAELVSAICDRRTGLGGDGVLRVMRTACSTEPSVLAQTADAEWFMDYRNADGSAAEMCGNGIRVFVRYLLAEGLASGPVVDVATRAGVTAVQVLDDGSLSARLGPLGFPVVTGPAERPYVRVDDRRWPAVSVTMPNPHAVVFVDSLDEAGPLYAGPELEPASAFPEGANVEFVQVVEPGHLTMRVHERGVGETQSCGTGACAAVAAARRLLAADGLGVPETWQVDVPGGRLEVTEHDNATMDLRGPAVLVASGTFCPRCSQARQ